MMLPVFCWPACWVGCQGKGRSVLFSVRRCGVSSISSTFSLAELCLESEISAVGWLLMVSFACRPSLRESGHAPPYGFPVEADHCRCKRQLVWRGHSECSMCGRLPERTVRRSWERQARKQGSKHAGVPALRF